MRAKVREEQDRSLGSGSANMIAPSVSFRTEESVMSPFKHKPSFARSRILRPAALACAVLIGTALAGCQRQRPLEPSPVPPRETGPRIESEARRPLPADANSDEAWYLEDAPLTDVPPPEAGPFLEAYNAVGRPKIVVFVNRTLEGALMPMTQEQVLSGRRHVIETTGAADVRRTERTDTFAEGSSYYRQRYGERHTERDASLTTTGPTRIEERTEDYIPPTEYDEIWAKRIDYSALENALADAMGIRGEVTVMSPQFVRQRLTQEEVAALEAGRPAVLEGLAERLGADILIHVQARPTAQTVNGLDLRIVAEAVNTVGGESVGRANADFPGPMSAARLDRVSRYLGRRLMDDMTGAWLIPAPGEGQAQPPATQPTGPE